MRWRAVLIGVIILACRIRASASAPPTPLRAAALGTGAGSSSARRSTRSDAGGSPAAPCRSLLACAALLALWLIVDPRTPDLAAQVYRVGLFQQLGFAVWDEHWYGGHDLPGYSLLFPPLALAARAARCWRRCACSPRRVLFERLVAAALRRAPARWGAALFAVAAARRRLDRTADVRAGRLARARGRARTDARARAAGAAVLAALCAAASPVAGAAAGAGGSDVRSHRARRARWLVLAAPAAVVVLALAALFPEGGFEPYPVLSFAATIARRGGVPVGAAAARAAAAHRGAASICWPAWLSCWCTRRWAATSSATACCWRGHCCCARCSRSRAARRVPVSARSGRWRCALALCVIGGVGRVGAGARDAGGRGQRIDERRLLRARRALPGARSAAGGAGARRGAAHALALGGGAARADACRSRAAGRSSWTRRYDDVLLAHGLTPAALRALAARAGRRLRGAAGHAARSLERPGGPR